MERLGQHLDELVRLMDEKEYDGMFLTNSGHPGKLKDSLLQHLNEHLQGSAHIPPFFVTTYSFWKSEEHPYVKCDFKLSYDKYEGFKVDKMKVEHANKYGTIKRIEVRPENNREIPTRESANGLAGRKQRKLKL